MGSCQCSNFCKQNEVILSEQQKEQLTTFESEEIDNNIITVCFKSNTQIRINIDTFKIRKKEINTDIISFGCKILQLNKNEFIISGGIKQEHRFTYVSKMKIVEQKMLYPRIFHGLVYDKIRAKIYVISGFNEILKQFQNKCEYYDLNIGQMRAISTIGQPVIDFGAGILKDTIYIFGGEYDDEYTNLVQCYQIQNDT